MHMHESEFLKDYLRVYHTLNFFLRDQFLLKFVIQATQLKNSTTSDISV